MCQPDDDFLDFRPCPECNGEGFVCDCCDDICASQGYCIHEDGNVTCGMCLGEGEIFDPIDDERDND